MNVEVKFVADQLMIAEEEQIVAAAQRDPEAFRPLYDAYFGGIFRFTLHRVGDRETAADVTQQVFFKALQGIGRYRSMGLPFSSWLYRIAINECNGFFRKTKRDRIVNLSSETLEILHEELTAETRLDDLERKLPAILQRLGPDEITMIELRFFEKRSFSEIGALLGLTEINAKVKTYRILKKMKKLFTA